MFDRGREHLVCSRSQMAFEYRVKEMKGKIGIPTNI